MFYPTLLVFADGTSGRSFAELYGSKTECGNSWFIAWVFITKFGGKANAASDVSCRAVFRIECICARARQGRGR